MKLIAHPPLVLLTVVLIAGQAAADIDVENGEAESFLLSAYARVRYSEFGGPLTVPDRSFTIESAGLTADLTVTDEVDGQLQIEARPGEIFLKDCFLRWEPFPYAGLQAGQFKKPFCLNAMTGTWDLQSIDHSITDRKLYDLLYSGRDLGAELRVSPGIRYVPELSLGVFNGSADPENQDSELQYAARMEVDFPYSITLGVDATMLRFGEPDIESVSGYTVSARQQAIGADLQFETDISDRFSTVLMGELIRGDNWAEADVVHGADAPSFQTWWVTGGLTWKTHTPALKAVSASVCMASWRPDRSLSSREDELTVTLGFDTGTPVSVQMAAVRHLPNDIPAESDRTDYLLEMALDL
jgi:hypothetical protein